MYVVGGLERIPAIFIHIELPLVVLLAMRENKFVYVIYAILLHPIMDVAPVMYQASVIKSVWIAKCINLLYGIAAVILIIKSKKLFQKS